MRRTGVATAVVMAAVVLGGCTSEQEPPRGAADPSRTWPVKAGSLSASPFPQYGALPGTPTPGPTPTPTACPASGVVITIGEVNAAMGRRATVITLRNCGRSAYHVNGYPQVGALDKDREPLKLKITHGEADAGRVRGPEPITLAPGKSAVSVLNWTNRVTSFDPPKPGAYLVIAPSADEEKQTLPFTLDMGTAAELDVTAWAVDPGQG
ncbi:DUF4232 domain-containing protein [Streptomyces sp. NBC_01481]|uniref:DUF4232 domain-containing protein n=1 Tax=Streptomyces sp. NBC_01481 TaxID=2975869 RepID=UPI0022516736|nr:DUF4232 domain-containing protein [Streptomyces sp. NBC_01481]MCX4582986.1 DUF4232 domain-containing protein [Streptomyces sp. NBC_01481]